MLYVVSVYSVYLNNLDNKYTINKCSLPQEFDPHFLYLY